MTNEEKNIRIAEACGWKFKQLFLGKPYGTATESWAAMHDAAHWNHEIYELPDYFNDLNACHEMRKFVKNKAAYCDAVRELTNIGAGSWCDWEFAKLNTTAAQEAEAFGKSHNLW